MAWSFLSRVAERQNQLARRKFTRRAGPAFIMSGLFLVFPGLTAILRQNLPLIA
jgi:hypothetical protein